MSDFFLDTKKLNELIGINNLRGKINFNKHASLEAQIATMSDDIAYNLSLIHI